MTQDIALRKVVPATIEPEDEPIDAKKLMQSIAMDIGKEVVAYIEIQYPKAIEATTSTFRLSVRNCIYNQIMAAFDAGGTVDEINARLKTRKDFRREWLAQWRKIRNQP